MKKFIWLFLIFVSFQLSTSAQVLKAKAIDEISTAYPKNIVKIEVLKDVILSEIQLKKGYVVVGSLTDVKSPNKGAKEASFTFTIIKYFDLNNREYNVEQEIKTVYKRKHIKFGENFLREADSSFSSIANMNVYSADTDITGRPKTYDSTVIKPLSIAESLLSEEYKNDLKDDVNYKTGLLNDGDDILILPGDKIKFDFLK